MLSASARRAVASPSLQFVRGATRSAPVLSARRQNRLALPCRLPTSVVRFSSTTGSEAAATTASAAAKEAPVRDFFLDNLGKIFLGIIAAIILSLVRSSYGTSNMKAQIQELEEASALDPLEIDELRQANGELTPDLFRLIQKELAAGTGGDLTYEEFVRQVRIILQREKGEHCTIGLGFLLDRVVIAALKNGRLKKKEPSLSLSGEAEEDDSLTMPLTFWMTVLSLALNGPVPDRIRILYELLEQQNAASSNNTLEEDKTNPKVTLGDVVTMVRYLQETCQLVPDKQVIPTETKYPTQQYRRGEPEELVIWGEAAAAAAAGANQDEVLDIDAFADILRSKSVCAWGECYFKKKFVP